MKKLILLGLLTYSATVLANQSVAVVLFAVDKVTAEQGGNQRTLSKGSLLFTGDVITTGSKARAQIKYTNGTLVSVLPNSHYETLKYSPKEDTSLVMKLNTGEIEYDSNQKSKKKNVLQTNVVSLAILGTHFDAKVNQSKTYLNVSKGNVCVQNDENNTSKKLCLGPGQELLDATFGPDGKFSPGNSFSPVVSNTNTDHLNSSLTNNTVATTNLSNSLNSIQPAVNNLTGTANIILTSP